MRITIVWIWKVKPGWWFGCHEFYFPIQLGMSSSQLTNSNLFQRGGPGPPTRNMFKHPPPWIASSIRRYLVLNICFSKLSPAKRGLSYVECKGCHESCSKWNFHQTLKKCHSKMMMTFSKCHVFWLFCYFYFWLSSKWKVPLRPCSSRPVTSSPRRCAKLWRSIYCPAALRRRSVAWARRWRLHRCGSLKNWTKKHENIGECEDMWGWRIQNVRKLDDE